jgi:hypothetical protein
VRTGAGARPYADAIGEGGTIENVTLLRYHFNGR